MDALKQIGPCWATWFLGVLIASPCWAEETSYVVEFRDGSVASLEIPDHMIEWQSVAVDGRITPQSLPFREVQELKLVLKPVTKRVRQVREWIDHLGDPDYEVREAASRELMAKAGPYLSVLKASRGSKDPEVGWRLEVVYQALLEAANEAAEPSYDFLILTPSSSAEISAGDAGDWEMMGSFRGQQVRLSRENVSCIRQGKLPEARQLAQARVGERLSETDIGRFPENRQHLNFDVDSSGQEIARGTVIDDEYSDMGVRFSSTVEDGYVGIFSYPVRGGLTEKNSAGGQWAKDQSKDYTGISTISFCKPGDIQTPATVNYFGCFLAIVVKDGTILKFFDSQGRLISEQATDNSREEQKDFVGFYSPTPIARVEIHPTAKDANYAFDDMLFDPPRPISEGESANRLTVVTKSGERIEGRGWTIGEDTVTLFELTLGVERLEIPRDQIVAIMPQRDGGATVPLTQESIWGWTSNGSLLRLSQTKGRFGLTALPEIEKSPEEFSSVWVGLASEGRKLISGLEGQINVPAVYFEGELSTVKEIRLLSDGWNWETEEGAAVVKPIEETPVIFFDQPWVANIDEGQLVTVDDQILIIDSVGCILEEWNGDQVVLKLEGKELRLAWEQVRSLRLPK